MSLKVEGLLKAARAAVEKAKEAAKGSISKPIPALPKISAGAKVSPPSSSPLSVALQRSLTLATVDIEIPKSETSQPSRVPDGKITPYVAREHSSNPSLQTSDRSSPEFALTNQNLAAFQNVLQEQIVDIVSRNPSLTEDELKSELNERFGADIADTLQVKMRDVGQGETIVEVNAIHLSKLTSEEQNSLSSAVKITLENFRVIDFTNDPKQTTITVRFSSGRYARAYGSTQIAETSARTDNQEFIQFGPYKPRT